MMTGVLPSAWMLGPASLTSESPTNGGLTGDGWYVERTFNTPRSRER